MLATNLSTTRLLAANLSTSANQLSATSVLIQQNQHLILNSKLGYCRQTMDIVNFFKLLALTMPAYMNTLNKKACHLYDNRNKHASCLSVLSMLFRHLSLSLDRSLYVCKPLFKHGKSSVKLKLKTKTNYNCFT